MALISIQSAVVYGHVGNCVASLPLNRLGLEVWRLDTVSFSNHPAHGAFTGRVVPADELMSLLDGVDRLGVLGRCRGVVAGYLGTPEHAAVAQEAVRRVKQANPAARFFLDPVIGDHGRVYVRQGVAEAIADLLMPLADVVKPNTFELGYLTGRPVETGLAARAAAEALLGRGPKAVVVSGLAAGPEIEMLAVAAAGGWRVRAPMRPRRFEGTGDLLAALIAGHSVLGAALPDALARAASGVAEAILATERLGQRELALIQAIDRIVAPPTLLAVEQLL
jgi:pyridoxine kinase